MTVIGDIMTADVATVEPDMSLREALDVLRAEDVTGAPVVQNGEVMGVLSITDIVEFEATNPGVPRERPEQVEWGEFESPEVWEEGADAPAAYFIDFWTNAGADVSERFEESDSPEWDVLEEHVVGEIMSRQVVALPPDAELRDAAQLMLEADVHRILVTEGGELKGILTTTDVVRVVAEGMV